ncbi:MAG: ABC transporter substrate-binding protein [Janthinobacterium lividum]
MSTIDFERRRILQALGALGAVSLVAGARTAFAADPLAATTFPGAWEEATRKIMLPAFRQATGAAVSLTASQAVDTLTKLTAARANPPFDVVMMDEGPYLSGVALGLFEVIPAAKVPNLANLPPRFIDPRKMGAYVSGQVYGIAYNTERIKQKPASWNDLLKPAFKGRVGIVGLDSTLGIVWMVALAKMLGGDEDHMDPAFDFLRRLMPNVGAVAANPGALGTLFQQGQIDISCHYINNVESLKAKGVPLALARPDSGWGLVRSTMNIVKNTRMPDLAAAYINTALSVDVQQQMTAAPYFVAPTNTKVPFGAALAAIAHSASDLENFVQVDWEKLNPRRASYIDRFNRLVKA